MARFIGEYECKIDSKGRIILPSKLRLQIPENESSNMVINRGFEKCLVLYTQSDWNLETQKLEVLNEFNREARKFIRQFNNGANVVTIDTQSRLNIPNNLIEYASLKDEIILSCYNNKIEMWDKKHYEQEMKLDENEFEKMAENLLGKNSTKTNEKE